MGRGRSATGGRRVHDVIVVQGREVGEFYDNGSVHHLRARGVAKVSREQRKSGAKALSTGVDQVARGGIREAIGLRNGVTESLLNERKARLEGLV